jgi:hypothetical protein
MSIMKTGQQRIWIMVGLIVGCYVLVCPLCHGSADPFLDGQIKVLDHRIGSWERSGQIVGWLVFLVFVIGLVVAALQAVTAWWMKILTGVLSVLSAGFVGYYHQFFPADDRSYNKAVRQARGLVETFVLQLEQYPTLDAPTKSGLYSKFQGLIKQVETIENATIYNSAGTSDTEIAQPNSGLNLLPSAHAQPNPDAARVPDWVSNVPSDEKNFYFLGKATAKSFEEARANALLNGRQAATAMFVKLAKGSETLAAKPQLVDQLVGALASSAEIAQTFVAPDSAAGEYRGYALLRVSRSAARFAAESIFVQTSTPYDKTFLDQVQKNEKN